LVFFSHIIDFLFYILKRLMRRGLRMLCNLQKEDIINLKIDYIYL